MTSKFNLSPFILCAILIAHAILLWAPQPASAVGFDTKILRAAGIGLLVKETAPTLNKFVNTVTFQNRVPIGMSTKVVPILSVGEKGYVGAAQIAGPAASVKSTQAVWLYEDNFSQNEFRLKILVPSTSLNPLQLKRVQKVGVSAIIDVALDGRWKGQSVSNSVTGGDILKAGVVAVAVNAAADPINRAINAVAKGSASTTRVVPIATIGDKAYIGGVQVSGTSASVRNVKAVFQYEELFDGGKYRVKVLVPSNSINPLKIKRVAGVGITALIDTSIADQERVRERERSWRNMQTRSRSLDVILNDRFKGDIKRVEPRHDNGLHKGWSIGKGNQKKQLSGIWVTRYNSLRGEDRDAFIIWWNDHYKDNPRDLEKRWQDWKGDRDEIRSSRKPDDEEDRPGRGRGRGKGRQKNDD